MTHEHQAVLDEARRIGFPYVHHSGSMHLAGEEQWTRNLPTLPLAALRELPPQLEAHAAAFTRHTDFAAREEQRDADAARRRVPLDPNDPNDAEAAEIRAMREDAAAAHARSEMPMTRGQGDALLATMRDVLDALRK